MKNLYELENLTFTISRDTVFKSIDCYEDSPVYEDVLETWEEIYREMCSLAKPVGILGFGALPASLAAEDYPSGTSVLYAVTSIGGGISKESTRAFQEGDYVKGMLCDAMADDALFSMEEQLMERIKEVCREHQVGVLARLEAPHHIPMEVQREAWERLELEKRLGIGISSGYMFDPVKTSCQVFILTEDTEAFNAHHDCRKCPNLKCKLRNIPDTEVVVQKGNGKKTILVKKDESLLDALIREKYYVNAVCGGRGHCGKCRVRILQGEVPVTEEDRAVFGEKELESGWRLSCRIYPMEKLEISFEQKSEEQFEILTSYGEEACAGEAADTEYEIAIDIGTTTIVLELLGRESGAVFQTESTINGQRVYGADVISRMQASVDGKKQELQECIRKDLQQGISRLLQKAGVQAEQIQRIAIGGNTTMGHLLMGYDCSTLGVYPFTPVNIDFIRETGEEILGMQGMNAEVILLPGVSTYVGGDIVSGMYACGFAEKEEVCLLVDLGTNGEMALGNRERILVTSTAAGPAFEGGNIVWGTGSIPGAICSVKLNGTDAEVQTIGNQPPQGICGTGVVETAAELVREELVEDSGMLDEDYFDDGFPLAKTPEGQEILFTQKDVREIQLAKAAVRAGMETLLLRYGIEKEAVSRVYIAGGFGYRLDIRKAIAIGMLPKEFEHCTEAVGNTSLAGAAKYLREEKGQETIKRLVEVSREIGLSADKDFNELYMDAMFFEAE